MKLFFSLMILSCLSSVGAFANNVPVYPNCYRGTLEMTNGQVVNVFLSFSSLEENLARIYEFKIGNSYHDVSGKLVASNQVNINENNDYIPGGNATYNVDISLQFDKKTATGFYKEYSFKYGVGGFGQSNPNTLTSEGTFNLRKCRVKTIDQ